MWWYVDAAIVQTAFVSSTFAMRLVDWLERLLYSRDIFRDDKGGEDVVDKMIDTYRTKVGTLRWPIVVFYTIIDIAALNSFVIWLHKYPNWEIKVLNKDADDSWRNLAWLLLFLRQNDASTVDLAPRHSWLYEQFLGKPNMTLTQPSASVAPSSSAGKCNVCILQNYGPGFTKAKNNAIKVTQRCEQCKKPASKKTFTADNFVFEL